jgi:hypothetical protein
MLIREQDILIEWLLEQVWKQCERSQTPKEECRGHDREDRN